MNLPRFAQYPSSALPTRAPYIVLALMAAAILMQVELVFAKSINWDEFFHFSQIHRHLQGRPLQWLQVPHVWLFFWVPSLSSDNILNIQIIRALILPFELVSIAAIVLAARRLAGREEALLCGLLYVTGGYVFLHAFAVRADMIAAALLTTALCIGIRRELKTLETVTIVVLVGLAFIATIKSILYAPAFLGVALFRLQHASQRHFLAGITAAGILAAITILMIAPSLPEAGIQGLVRDMGLLGRESVDRMFTAGLFPQAKWLQAQIVRAPLLSALLAYAVFRLIKSDRPAIERVLVLSLMLPLCTVAVYRNAFPYHFVFVLPPAIIALAPSITPLLRRISATPLALALFASALALSLAEDRSVLDRQRNIQDGIKQIFPAPVAYIDDCGMVGDFPRVVNHFASGWGLANYRRDRSPTYSKGIETEPVPLVLANNGLLLGQFFDFGVEGILMPEDEQAFKETYIQHWGLVFVAGKRIAPGDNEAEFRIRVPGPYTVEGGSVVLNGEHYPAGSVVNLEAGRHHVSGTREKRITLRWGNHLSRPSHPWPDEPFFTQY